jgi:hypothetical protein
MVMNLLIHRLRFAPLLIILLLTTSSGIPAGAGPITQACAYNPLVAGHFGTGFYGKLAGLDREALWCQACLRIRIQHLIHTRLTELMFNGGPNARAYDFVYHLVQTWYPEQFIEEHELTVIQAGRPKTWSLPFPVPAHLTNMFCW